MATKFTGALRGMRETKRAFRQIDPVMKDRLNDATGETADRVAFSARQRVRVVTGNLQSMIMVSRRRKSGVALVGIAKGRLFRFGRPDVPARRAHFEEFGTSRVRGRPFMIPAAEHERPLYLRRVRQAGRDAEGELARAGGRFL